jgi:RHS repeat-associated protein
LRTLTFYLFKGITNAKRANYFKLNLLKKNILEKRKYDYYLPEVFLYNHYYPFGMPMPSRNQSTENYRYGYQNQEKDDEIKGEGNSLNYEYRMHDPRLGRFFARDPLAAKYAYNSPYAFSENRVIDGVELEGLEYVSVDNSGINPDVHKNDDDTYSFSLGDEKFDHVSMEKIDGVDYFRLGRDMYYGKKGWSTSSGLKKEKFTSDLGGHEEYLSKSFRVNIWPEMTGTQMSEVQKTNLDLGCIGVTMCFLNSEENVPPSLTHAYSTFELAQRKKAEMEAKGNIPEGLRLVIFSKRFYTDDETKYLPDENGRIAIGDDFNYSASKDGFTNFDYGFLDEYSGRWWHADHKAPRMHVFESTLEYYSRDLDDFNRQVFVIGITPLGPLKR